MGAKKKPLDKVATGDAADRRVTGGRGRFRVTTVIAPNPPTAKEKGTIIEDEDTNETV